MKVVYDGPQPSRTVEVGGSKQVTVKRGVPTEVPKQIGEQLLEQKHFSAPAKTTKAKTTKAKTTKAKTTKEGE
jgi:hypothetical protein